MKIHHFISWSLPRLAPALFIAMLLLTTLAMAEPKIACRNPSFNFGDSGDRKVIEQSFVIWNDGNEPLNITGSRACCGGTMTVADKVVPPGSNTTCVTTLVLKGRNGKQNVSFYIMSNDAKQQYFQLQMTGTVVLPISLVPQTVDFGLVRGVDTTNIDLSVTCVSNLTINITNAVIDNACFGVNYCRKDGKGVWKVSVRTVPPIPNGVVRGVLKLSTDNPQHPVIEADVMATVASDLVVVPREIMLPMQTGVPSPVVRYVAIKSRAGKPFKVVKIEPPEPDIKVESQPLTSGGYRITLKNIMPFEDLHGRNLTIITDHEEVKQVTLPFKVSGHATGARTQE